MAVDEERGANVGELRRILEVSQAAVAYEAGTTQAAVHKAERSRDPRVSTLRSYIEALGRCIGSSARLRVVASIGEADHEISTGSAAAEVAERIENDSVTESDESPAVWRLRAWNDARLEQRFLSEATIAISEDELGDLTEWPSESTLRERLAEAFRSRSPQAIGTFVTYWRGFRQDMQIGDVVVVPLRGRRVAIGEVTGGYAYNTAEPDPRMRHRRSVHWLAEGLDRADLDDDLRRVVNAPGTICRIRAIDAAQRLISSAEG